MDNLSVTRRNSDRHRDCHLSLSESVHRRTRMHEINLGGLGNQITRSKSSLITDYGNGNIKLYGSV